MLHRVVCVNVVTETGFVADGVGVKMAGGPEIIVWKYGRRERMFLEDWMTPTFCFGVSWSLVCGERRFRDATKEAMPCLLPSFEYPRSRLLSDAHIFFWPVQCYRHKMASPVYWDTRNAAHTRHARRTYFITEILCHVMFATRTSSQHERDKTCVRRVVCGQD